MKAALTSLLLAGLAAPSLLTAQGLLPAERQNLVTVSGTAAVVVKPDLATLELGVSTKGTVVRTVVDENNTQTAKIIAYLKSHGVKPEHIETLAFVLRPTERDGVRTGYEVHNSIRVSTTSMGDVGAMIDAAIDSGATEVRGPEFAVQNEKTVQEQCLTSAFADAKAKAKRLAELAGRPLGQVVVVTDKSSLLFEYAVGMEGGVPGAFRWSRERAGCGVALPPYSN